jgi:hypothetical protein
MVVNSHSSFGRIGGWASTVVIGLVMAALLVGCDDNGNGSGEVYLNETSSSPASTRMDDSISIDNCANQSEESITLERRLDISVEGSVGVSVQALEAKIGTQYARGETSSVTLTAAPGTHMVFEVEWTEEAFFGDITVDGQTGKATYRVGVETPREVSNVDRGCIAGNYGFVGWDEAPSDFTIYMDVDDGSLRIDPSGDAVWVLMLRESGEYPDPQPQVFCYGRFYASSEQLEGIDGSEAINWTSDMTGFSHDIYMTFCGRGMGGETDPFTLHPRELGGGERRLEMRNSRGTLIWQAQSD